MKIEYECLICGKIFNNVTNFQAHTASAKACDIQLNKNIGCDVCDKKFTTKRAKDAHIKKLHPDNIVDLESELNNTKQILINLEKQLKKKKNKLKKIKKLKK